MALQDVLSAIRYYDGNPPFPPFNSPTLPPTLHNILSTPTLDQRQKIEEAITKLYASDEGKAILEAARARGHLNFVTSIGGSAAMRGFPTIDAVIALDYNEIASLYYFNTNGRIISEIFEVTLIHEIIHTEDLDDPLQPGVQLREADINNASLNFNGDVVDKQNKVSQQLGYNDNIQASYYSTMRPGDPIWNRFDHSTSYSHGNKIDYALWDQVAYDSSNNYDLSTRASDSNDILFGFGGADTLNGGGGDDYLYGGEGDDTFSGAAGSDFFHGGGTKRSNGSTLAIDDDGIDTANYDGIASDERIKISTDTSSDSQHANALDGTHRYLVFKGKGIAGSSITEVTGIDALVSIEKIVGTGKVDEFELTKFDANQLAGSDGKGGLAEIDFGANDKPDKEGDLIDARSLAEEGLKIDLNGTVEIKGDADKKIKISNAERAWGSEQADELIGTSGDNELIGGGGEDIIKGGGGDDILVGGYGANGQFADDGAKDTITSGGGADKIYLGNEDIITDEGRLSKQAQVYAVEGAPQDPMGTMSLMATAASVKLLVGGESEAPPANPCAPSGGPSQGDGKTYIAADGTKYTLSSGTLTVDYGGGTVFVEGFRNGDAGIRLKDARPAMDQAECQRDPLIIDLDGDRNVVRELFDSFAYFDLDNDGFRERVAWSLPADGFLVRDLNSNGQIDNGTEMFGSGRTERDAAESHLLGTAGFAELALLDSNSDGLISAADVQFETLRVWVDANGDAVTDSGELKTLDELGLVSISLATFVSDDLDCGCDGTEIAYATNAFFVDGSARNVYDAYLSIDQYDSREIVTDVTVPGAIAELPFLLGSGSLPDLDVAMARDPALEEMVRAFAALDVAQVHEAFDRAQAILLRWTGADQVAIDSRGSNINAQWLRAIEVISGSGFNQARVGTNPRADAAAMLVEEWQEIVQRATGKLLGQTTLGEVLMPALRFASAAFFQAGEGAVIGDIIANLASYAPADAVARLKYWQVAVSTVRQYAGSLNLSDDEVLAAFDAHPAFAPLSLTAADLAAMTAAGTADATVLGTKRIPGLTSGHDILLADADRVRLNGAGGNDVYVVHRGVQDVHIASSIAAGSDRVVLLDVNRSDVTIGGNLWSLPEHIADLKDVRIGVTLTDANSGWTMTLDSTFSLAGGWQVTDVIDFADEKNVPVIDLLKGTSLQSPFGQVYFLSGPQTHDHGTTGDDIFVGSHLSDSFSFIPGSGADMFVNPYSEDSNEDVLTIAALQSEITFRIDDDGASLLVQTQEGQALLLGHFRDGQAIERFVFADGSERSAAEILHGLLTGTTGNDAINGTTADDLIDGGGGSDIVRGGSGNDTYRFASGYGGLRIMDPLGTNTVELPGISSDRAVLMRNDGETVLMLGSGADTIVLEGNQPNFLFQFADRTVSLAQLLLEQGQVGGNSPPNLIMGSIFSDYNLWGTDGNDVIVGMGNYDYIGGGLGDDTYIYSGAQFIDFQDTDGFDIVRPAAQFTWDNVIVLPRAVAFEGETFGRINHGNRYVTNTGLPSSSAGMYVDAIVFADGRSIDLTSGWKDLGTADSDILFNFSSSVTTFQPGAGNDRIFSYGSSATKIVVLQEGFGHDVWYQRANFQLDMTAFALDARVSFARDGNDLVIRVDGQANSMTVVDAFHPYVSPTSTTVRNAGSVVQFAGGVVLSLSDIANRIAVATAGSDILFGRTALEGGGGDDVLIGSNAANTYRFGRGHGNDTIKEQGQGTAEYAAADTLVMDGLNAQDVTFARHPADPKSIVITILDTGETLVIDGTPWDDYRYIDNDGDEWETTNDRFGAHWVEEIRFADGTVISQRDVEQQLLDAEQTSGDDTLVSFGAPNVTSGIAGSYLDGGAGNDTYINHYQSLYLRMAAGSGNDIVQTRRGAFPDYTVRLVGISAADISIEFDVRDGAGYTILKARDGTSIAFDQTMAQFRSLTVVDEAGVRRTVFQDGGLVANLIGTAGDDHLVSGVVESLTNGSTTRPNAVVDVFDGGAGNDVIAGYAGDDIVRFGRGDGTDLLLQSLPLGASRNQFQRYMIEFDSDVAREDVDIGWVLDGSGRVSLTIRDTGDRILLNPDNFGAMVFADGRRVQTANTGNGAEIINFTSFQPTASAGDDILILRSGQTATSGAGDDTVYYVSGGFDLGTIEFGSGDGHDVFVNRAGRYAQLSLRDIISLDEVRFIRAADDPDDLIIEIIATGDTLRLVDQLSESSRSYTDGSVSDVYLADGSYHQFWNLHPRIVLAENGDVDETVSTGAAGGILTGGPGFDELRGGAGDDFYVFGRAFDEDVIRDAGGLDALLFEDGISRDDVVFSRAGANGGDLLIEVLGTERLSMMIAGQFQLSSARIESFRFSDGSLGWSDIPALILGDAATSGADVIEGFATNDRIDGLAGSDRIAGSGGDDSIDGGPGADVGVYSGSREQYQVTTTDGVTTVTDLVSGRNGTDTLVNVEDLYFAGDGSTLPLLTPNTAPTAEAATVSGIEDQDVVIARATLLDLVSDADGDPVALSVEDPSNGKVWIGLDGNIRFRPDANFNGPASFAYTATDSDGGQATARVSIIIAPVNDAPQSIGGLTEVSFEEDTPIAIDLSEGLFLDIDGDALEISAVQADGTALPGWLAVADGILAGTPPANFNGTISLLVVGSDGASQAQRPLTLVLRPVNDAPEILGPLPDVDVGTAAQFTFGTSAAPISDADGDPVILSASLADGSALPDWIVFDGTSFSGVAPSSVVTLQIALWASDGLAEASTQFTLNVSESYNYIIGTAAADDLYGTAGRDHMTGGGGDDKFYGSAGADVIDGGDGLLDRILYNNAIAPVSLSLVTGGTAGDAAGDTYTGVEWVYGTNYGDFVEGDDAKNSLFGGNGNDELLGGAGDDELRGGSGSDILRGGDGNDRIRFEDYTDGVADQIFGEGGDDQLRGGDHDSVDGGAGNDSIQVSGNHMTVLGGDGNDSITLSSVSNLQLNGGAGHDQMSLTSSGGINARFTSLTSIEMIYGNGAVGLGVITIDAPSLDLSSARFVNNLDLVAGLNSDTTITGPVGGTSPQLGHLRVFGAGGNDSLTGSAELGDQIFGKAGHDQLFGLGGNDSLTGGAGNDQLDGGTGADTALFSGELSTYSIVTSGGTLMVQDNDPAGDGDDGTDVIVGIETLSFKNGETVSVISPIVLDLEGDGIETLSAQQSRARIDLDGDGRADNTSWIGRGEGLLYLDRNGDGTMSGADEISFIDDVPGAASDLAGLRAFDSNHDGTLDASDEAFADFGVWRDANGNGQVEKGETQSLSGVRIASLELAGTSVEGAARFGEVATVNTGTFTLTDGTTRGFADAALTFFSGFRGREEAPRSTRISKGSILRHDLFAEHGFLANWHEGTPAAWRTQDMPLQRQLFDSDPAEREPLAKRTQDLPLERGPGLAFADIDLPVTADGLVLRKLALMRQDMSTFGTRAGEFQRLQNEGAPAIDWFA